MSNQGKAWLLTCDEGAEGVWESECCLYYLIQRDRFRLKLLHSETAKKIVMQPIRIVLSDSMRDILVSSQNWL